MLNCWCITWPVGFKRLIYGASLQLNRAMHLPSMPCLTNNFSHKTDNWTQCMNAKNKPTILTALSRSQSSNIISGDFPPSSSETFFRFESAQVLIITCPTPVLPVNPSLRISGCRAMALPVSEPGLRSNKHVYFHVWLHTLLISSLNCMKSVAHYLALVQFHLRELIIN